MIEIWKTIDEYPNYQVSNMGNVKSLNYNRTGKEKLLRIRKGGRGYCQVYLYNKEGGKNHYIHRLVCLAFIPNPKNLPEINHINEDKTDNRVENLEWCDTKYNLNYGNHNKNISKSNSIPILQFTPKGELVKKWESIKIAENTLKIYNIVKICKGKYKTAGGYKWKYYYKGIWLKNHIPLKDKRVA